MQGGWNQFDWRHCEYSMLGELRNAMKNKIKAQQEPKRDITRHLLARKLDNPLASPCSMRLKILVEAGSTTRVAGMPESTLRTALSNRWILRSRMSCFWLGM